MAAAVVGVAAVDGVEVVDAEMVVVVDGEVGGEVVVEDIVEAGVVK